MPSFEKPRISILVRLIMITIITSMLVIGIANTAKPVFAYTILCKGSSYSACTNAGYTDHGYGSHNQNSYWGAYPGHNCTNYVAYVETQNGIPRPSYKLGNAYQWWSEAQGHVTESATTPVVGSVAWWGKNQGGVSSDGHVAYVEAVSGNAGSYTITISEDAYPSGPFDWMKIAQGDPRWPGGFIYFDGSSPLLGTANLIKNGDFGLGGNYWSRIGPSTNFSILSNSGGTTPYEGNQYMATNTQDAGGSVYQDISVTLKAGDTICASVMLTTYGTGSSSSGNIALWINGQGSEIQYSNIPGNDVWSPFKVCNTASSSANSFRFQIYPGVGSPTVAVDTIDANKSLVENGDFGLGGNYWSRIGPSTNFSILSNSGGTTPYEGNQYMATNTQDAGGSVYQDVPLTISSGDTICARTMLTTYGTGSGSSGNIALWINGQGSEIQYSNIPGNDVWTPYEVCNTASSSANSFRFQIYPGVGSPTVAVDTIDANKSLVENGDFGLGGNYWYRTGPSTNFSILSNSGGTTPYEGNQYMATNTQDAGGSVYQDISVTLKAGDTICASVMLTTYGTGSSSSGNIALWINGQGSEIQYSNIPGNDVWSPFKVCNTASSSANSFRFQIYPGVGSPTVAVDTIDDGL